MAHVYLYQATLSLSSFLGYVLVPSPLLGRFDVLVLWASELSFIVAVLVSCITSLILHRTVKCSLVLFSSVAQSCPTFCDPWSAACQASLSITNSRSAPKPMSIKSVMPFNHLILCHPLLLLPSIFPSIRVFSNSSHQVAEVLNFQFQHQSFGWISRVDFP